MKTLYEVLEVSENASKEIIEKAYRVLAKKYHPDLQAAENKQEAENKMKEINEAYSILGDETKRKEYDNKLASQREAEETSKMRYEPNNEAQNYQNNSQGAYYKQQNNSQQSYYGTQNRAYSQKQRPTQAEYREAKRRQEEAIRRQQQMEQEMQEQYQAQYEEKYQRAYENYLRSLGYKIKYKWTWKNYRDFFIAILIIIGICTALWIFPPTHNMIMDFYNSNTIFKTIIDVIGGIIEGIWNAICSIFK